MRSGFRTAATLGRYPSRTAAVACASLAFGVSAAGLCAARTEYIATIVMPSTITSDEDYSGATCVISNLGRHRGSVVARADSSSNEAAARLSRRR